jgi:hypothetical protein
MEVMVQINLTAKEKKSVYETERYKMLYMPSF